MKFKYEISVWHGLVLIEPVTNERGRGKNHIHFRFIVLCLYLNVFLVACPAFLCHKQRRHMVKWTWLAGPRGTTSKKPKLIRPFNRLWQKNIIVSRLQGPMIEGCGIYGTVQRVSMIHLLVLWLFGWELERHRRTEANWESPLKGFAIPLVKEKLNMFLLENKNKYCCFSSETFQIRWKYFHSTHIPWKLGISIPWRGGRSLFLIGPRSPRCR